METISGGMLPVVETVCSEVAASDQAADIRPSLEEKSTDSSSELNRNAETLLTDTGELKSIVLDLHSKGKSAKQIANHFSLSQFGKSEFEVLEIIKTIKGSSDC